MDTCQRRIFDTFICKVGKKSNLEEELEESTVIYNSLILNDGVVYTIYCTRAVALQIKNKGYNLIEV